MENIEPRPLYKIAADIRKEWKKVYFGAVPYLQAMQQLNGINDKYDFDNGGSIISYFLANAGTFRGPAAKLLKEELKNLLKN